MPSPLLERTNAQPLSLELLKEHVPVVRAGYEANQRLIELGTEVSREEKRSLLTAKMKGSRSQETLIISALPLIKSIASKEFQRRRAWNSRVSYDDILQEAIAGFIRGLLSYKEDTNRKSATNYLGQWITTSIRRRVEVMEHDFSIPYEVVERARRIRAVTSRLANELGREANDEEILVGLNSAESYKGGYKWGKAATTEDETAAPTARQKQFTQRHLDEARGVSDRSYSIHSQDANMSSDETETYERASDSITVSAPESQENIVEADLARSRSEFFENVFAAIQVGSKQRDIILRRFGMRPYTEEETEKQIAANAGYPPRFVKQVIIGFSTYMSVKGGMFHRLLITMDAELVEELELAWLLPLLGDWPERQVGVEKPPVILTQTSMTVRSSS